MCDPRRGLGQWIFWGLLLAVNALLVQETYYVLRTMTVDGLRPEDVLHLRLQYVKSLVWDPVPGLSLHEELARSARDALAAAIVFGRASAILYLSVVKIFLRFVTFSAPWCHIAAAVAYETFMKLDTRYRWAVVCTVVTLALARKIWQHRYITKALDLINRLHYRVSKFLTFVGPYVLVVMFGYFPLRWWQRSSARFRTVYSNTLLLIMIFCSLKIIIDYNYAASTADHGQPRDKPQTNEQYSGNSLYQPRGGSPMLVEKLRLLVTPRPLELRMPLNFDARYRASNSVIVCLSSWLGLIIYQLVSAPMQYVLLVLAKRPTFNLWISLYGHFYATSERVDLLNPLGKTFAIMDEIVITIVFIAILARDNTFARYARNMSAIFVDAILTKITGFSVRTIQSVRESGDEDNWQNMSHLSFLIQLLPYAGTIQNLLNNWSTVQSLLVHFLPLLLLTLPAFCIRFICLLYAGFYPLTFASRAAVSGGVIKSNYWLSYFVVLFGAILFSHTCSLPHMRSSRVKMLMIMMTQYCIDSPRHIVTLVSKMTSTDDASTRDDDAGTIRFGRMSSAMQSAPPSPLRVDREGVLE